MRAEIAGIIIHEMLRPGALSDDRAHMASRRVRLPRVQSQMRPHTSFSKSTEHRRECPPPPMVRINNCIARAVFQARKYFFNQHAFRDWLSYFFGRILFPHRVQLSGYILPRSPSQFQPGQATPAITAFL